MTQAVQWIRGMSDADYHASEAVSSSFVRTLLSRSPAHARAAVLEPRPETPALLLGRAVHARALEPDTFDSRFAIAPQVDRRTKAGKAEWAAFTEAHPDAVILTETDGELVESIGAAIQSHPLVASLLSVGEAEVSGFWTDPETGVRCRCRFDWLRPDRIGADLKTALDASPREFQRSIAKYGYHTQAAFYAMGHEAITGETLTDFAFIVVEKAPPFAVGVYRLDEGALELGRKQSRRALRTIADCIAADHWPAYSAAVEPITVPAWVWHAEDAEDIA